jgi:hypothetical protein
MGAHEASKPSESEINPIDQGLDKSRVLHVGTQNPKITGGLQRGEIGQV